jgi:hypothetical protein
MGTDISNLVGTGQRAGASLQAQLGQSGLEGYLQAAELGQNEKLASLQSMANTVGGTGGASGLLGGLDQYLPDWLQNLVGGSGSDNAAALANLTGTGTGTILDDGTYIADFY